ncbi:CoA transferase [Bradyrhizobium sp. ISRA443]|uniref:CaiB/BaiF CoA transferase family protein n=1 Tax=unclassified Bradyrhizobium TaxID=2631580 RepID=UPI002479E644|nr:MULTISPECIES: CoA transferase [unclassified Bradyrhizobium]WGS01113.1 CoA transferase [Bradyrhizobium sp. ISRA436]WGS08000.1 CoA transferase [Bradyrhizobium sp. ISRA437]WGS14888.1 CoA transferase [Bradyrhizobium sp. ISRA443]
MTKPLAGIRVIELGELIAGPFVGTLLADNGAEVIKVERPGRGDVLRQFGPIVEGTSAFWQVNSRNKKSVVVDITRDGGLVVLRDLIKKCDILIGSLRPGVLEQRGLSDEALRVLNHAIVVVHVSAFGRIGPKSKRGGYDPVAQGFCGLSYLTGERDGPPMRAGGAVPVCDFMTGLLDTFGAMLALQQRKAGLSPIPAVDVALYDVAFRMIAPLLAYFEASGKAWQRDGNHSLGGAPTGHFMTADEKWICLSVQNDEQFARCAGLVGRPEWVSDPRFATLSGRTEHRSEIEAWVSKWIRSMDRTTALAAFEAQSLGAGPIQSIEDMASDEHLNFRGLKPVSDPVLGAVRMPRALPFATDKDDGQRPAPKLGEHTRHVLSQVLGYADQTIADMIEDGRIASG